MRPARPKVSSRLSPIGAVVASGVPLLVGWLTRPHLFHVPVLADGSLQRPASGMEAWEWYGWPTLFVSSLIAGGLGLFVHSWWLKVPHQISSRAKPWRRWEMLLAVGLVALGGAIRLPLMTAEMHRDEQDNLVHQIHGMYHHSPPSGGMRGGPRPMTRQGSELPESVQDAALAAVARPEKKAWVARSWVQTAFDSPFGNNSPPNSLLARVCNSAWRAWVKAEPSRYNLTALRLPAFIALTVSPLLLFAALRRWFSNTWAATLGVLVFSFHPMVIRFGALSRGYALMMLSLVVVLYAWSRVLEGRSHNSGFLLAAFATGGAVWCFTGFALAGGALSFGLLVASLQKAGQSRWEITRQWAGAHLAAAAFWLPMIAPMLVQTAFVMAYDFPMNSDHLAWLPRYLGAGLVGTILPTREQLPFTTGLARPEIWLDVWRESPFEATALFVLLPILVTSAVIVLVRQRHGAGWAAGCLMFSALATALLATWGHHKQLLYWYSCYLTPVGALCVAALLAGGRSFLLRLAVTGLAFLLLAAGFPNGHTGRLPLFPAKPFERLAARYRGYWVISSNEGRSVAIPIR